MQPNEKFAGDKKVGKSLLWNLEQKFIAKCIPRIPSWIQSYHLTLSTFVWSFFIIIFGYLASKYSVKWFWGTTLMVFIQYLTDSLDGALGRYRKMGLVRWGYYMDHFLDYIFLCSLLIGYSFTFKDEYNTLFFILATYSAFMVNSFLGFSATNEFRISYLKIGPTEIRLGFIITNILIIFSHDKVPLSSLLPYIFVFSMLGLAIVIYRTQKIMWDKDRENNVDKQASSS
jgi:archaetidylinositol phosphate synthase